jgi:hypothetical protein
MIGMPTAEKASSAQSGASKISSQAALPRRRGEWPRVRVGLIAVESVTPLRPQPFVT